MQNQGISASSDRKYLFLIASSRRDGNSETLARHAAAELPAGASVEWLRLLDLPLPMFADIRHEGDGVYPSPLGNEKILMDATLAASDLVIVAPLYWYSLPATAKLYLDYWSAWMRVPGTEFRQRMKQKKMWVVSVNSGESADVAEPLVGSLRLSAGYMGMEWGGVLLGYGNRPNDVLANADTLAQAKGFFDQAGLETSSAHA